MSTFRALACGPRQRGTANSELKLSKPPKAAWRGRRRPVAGCGGRERPGDRASPSPPQRLCTAPARGGRERPGDRASPSPPRRLGTAPARPCRTRPTAEDPRAGGREEAGCDGAVMTVLLKEPTTSSWATQSMASCCPQHKNQFSHERRSRLQAEQRPVIARARARKTTESTPSNAAGS